MGADRTQPNDACWSFSHSTDEKPKQWEDRLRGKRHATVVARASRVRFCNREKLARCQGDYGRSPSRSRETVIGSNPHRDYVHVFRPNP